MKDEEIRQLLTLPQDWNVSDDEFDDSDSDSDCESTNVSHNTKLTSPIGTASPNDVQLTNDNVIDIENIPIMIVGTENELYNIETLDPSFFINDCSDIVHNSTNDFQTQVHDNSQNIIEDLPVSPLFTPRKQNNNIYPIHVAQQRERAGPLKWKKRKFITNEPLIKFSDKPLPSKFTDLSTPLSFFNYFFDEKLLDLIVEQTNLFSNDNVFTKKDIQKYLGICVFTSVVHMSSIRDYWSQELRFDPIADTMSLNNFEKIRRYLHFNDNSTMLPKDHADNDRLHKIRPVIDHLNNKYQSIPFSRDLCVDEQLCATKARMYLKQYMPMKPHKWGYKLFMLCDVNGFAHKFEIYTGSENLPKNRLPTEPDLGASANVVVRLTREVPKNVNHRVYFDNYYTTIELIDYLNENGINSLGTVRKNRIPNSRIPSDNMLKKCKRGSSFEYMATYKNTNISSVTWKDNKNVSLLSNYCGSLPYTKVKRFDRKKKQNVEVKCPALVIEYNRFMGGVDLLDSLIGRHKITMRTKKWYMRLFYHMLDMTIINAWLLYKRVQKENGNNAPMKLKAFRIDIATCLTKVGHFQTPKRGRPTLISIEEQFKEKKKRGKVVKIPTSEVRLDGNFHLPIPDKKQRCKRPQCSGFSVTKCYKCNVNLCMNKVNNCFFDFHTK